MCFRLLSETSAANMIMPDKITADAVSCPAFFIGEKHGKYETQRACHRANNGFEPHAAVVGKGPDISRHMSS